MLNKKAHPTKLLRLDSAEEIKGWMIDGSSISKSTLETPQKEHPLLNSLQRFYPQTQESRPRLKNPTVTTVFSEASTKTNEPAKQLKESNKEKPTNLIDQEGKYILDSLSDIEPEETDPSPVISPEFRPYRDLNKPYSKSQNPTPQRERVVHDNPYRIIIGKYDTHEDPLIGALKRKNARILRLTQKKPPTAASNGNSDRPNDIIPSRSTENKQNFASTPSVKYSNAELEALQEKMKLKESEIIGNIFKKAGRGEYDKNLFLQNLNPEIRRRVYKDENPPSHGPLRKLTPKELAKLSLAIGKTYVVESELPKNDSHRESNAVLSRKNSLLLINSQRSVESSTLLASDLGLGTKRTASVSRAQSQLKKESTQTLLHKIWEEQQRNKASVLLGSLVEKPPQNFHRPVPPSLTSRKHSLPCPELKSSAQKEEIQQLKASIRNLSTKTVRSKSLERVNQVSLFRKKGHRITVNADTNRNE